MNFKEALKAGLIKKGSPLVGIDANNNKIVYIVEYINRSHVKFTHSAYQFKTEYLQDELCFLKSIDEL